MLNICNINGLMCYDKYDILTRNYIKSMVVEKVKDILLKQNKAWSFHEIEATNLIPISFINPNYTEDDFFKVTDKLALKPETTETSYQYATHLLHTNKPPLCVYQASKSFRKEDEQPTKHMRLKEFYQLEFQCIYNKTTMNDYQLNVIEDLANMVRDLLKLQARILDSDRLPSYSERTIDIEVWNNDKWMEIASVSKRTDFNDDKLVLEIAFGLDRLLYNFNIKSDQIDFGLFNELKEYVNTKTV